MIYHPNPSDFIAKSSDYGALGKVLVGLSNLEFAHDEFNFEMLNKHHELSVQLSKDFPRHFKNKTNFLINSVSNVRELRKIPIFQNGELNLLWLQYQLDELYEIRSILAHGSVFFSENTPERITWTFERFVNIKKRTWEREAVKVSNGYLASVHWTAAILKHYLIRLKKCLEENSSWEDDYQSDKIIRKNQKFINELVAREKVRGNSMGISKLPPFMPIE